MCSGRRDNERYGMLKCLQLKVSEVGADAYERAEEEELHEVMRKLKYVNCPAPLQYAIPFPSLGLSIPWGVREDGEKGEG
jgi:hypothetical protein